MQRIRLKLSVSVIVFGMLMGSFACGRRPASDESQTMSNGVPVGDLRGTSLVNKAIRSRLLDQSQASALTFEIERLAGSEIYELRGLMGQFAMSGAHSEWRGGEPNPFGMLLWQLVAARFAEGLAKACESPGSLSVMFFDGTQVSLHSTFAAKLQDACLFAEDAEARKTIASNLWRAVVGFAAFSEEKAFVEFFSDSASPFANATPKERVEAMILAMVLNPHFILEK